MWLSLDDLDVKPDAKSSTHCWMTMDDLVVDPLGDAQTRQDVQPPAAAKQSAEQPLQITGRMCVANHIVRQSKKSSRLSAKLKNSGLIQKQLRKIQVAGSHRALIVTVHSRQMLLSVYCMTQALDVILGQIPTTNAISHHTKHQILTVR